MGLLFSLLNLYSHTSLAPSLIISDQIGTTLIEFSQEGGKHTMPHTNRSEDKIPADGKNMTPMKHGTHTGLET